MIRKNSLETGAQVADLVSERLGAIDSDNPRVKKKVGVIRLVLDTVASILKVIVGAKRG